MIKDKKKNRDNRDYLVSLLMGGKRRILSNKEIEVFEALRDVGLCYRHDDEEFYNNDEEENFTIKDFLHPQSYDYVYIIPDFGERTWFTSSRTEEYDGVEEFAMNINFES